MICVLERDIATTSKCFLHFDVSSLLKLKCQIEMSLNVLGLVITRAKQKLKKHL